MSARQSNPQPIRFDASGSHGHTVIADPPEQGESFGESRAIEILDALVELTPPGSILSLSQGNIIGAGSGVIGLHVKAVEFFGAAVDDVGLQEIGVG